MEPVKNCSIKNLKIIPDVDNSRLKLRVDTLGVAKNVTVKVIVKDGKTIVGEISGKAGKNYPYLLRMLNYGLQKRLFCMTSALN